MASSPNAAYQRRHSAPLNCLHQLGDQRLGSDSTDALVTRRSDGAIVVALWNYAEPGENVEPKVFRLKLKNSSAKKYRLQIVDPAHGSALAAWKKMGKPATPTKAQIAQLVEASKLGAPTEHSLK